MIDNNLKDHVVKVPVLIVGGGLVGGLLAVVLKKKNIPFILVDPDSPQNMLDTVADGRTTAMSLASANMFKTLGIWQDSLQENACPIHKIHVFEEGSFCGLQFDYADVSNDPMGYVVENYYIRESLLKELQNEPNCFYNTSVVNIQKNDAFIDVTLSNRKNIQVQLLVSAEGRNSPSRRLIATQIKSRDYAQKALVVHLKHEKLHQFRAFEVFTKNGPFAILPLKDDHFKKSGIVFAKSSDFAWDKYTDRMIEDDVKKIFPFYGDVKIVSKRWHFSLSSFHVDRLFGHRQVLIGDAAHGMHPLAGQGLNLGWRDVKDLSTLLQQYYLCGLDLGSSLLLNNYEKLRQKDIQTFIKMTDFMNQLFQYDSKAAYFIRNAGLGIVNQIAPLRRFLMKKAMGI